MDGASAVGSVFAGMLLAGVGALSGGGASVVVGASAGGDAKGL